MYNFISSLSLPPVFVVRIVWVVEGLVFKIGTGKTRGGKVLLSPLHLVTTIPIVTLLPQKVG